MNIKSIELEIAYPKNINEILDLKNRDIQFFKEPIDIEIIQIKDEDSEIMDNVSFITFNGNYRYKQNDYKNAEILVMGYPKGKKIVSENGKIVEINENEFEHNASTDRGSSGSPIFLSSTSEIIGVHKSSNIKKNLNLGIFIDVILNKLKCIIINKNKHSKNSKLKNKKIRKNKEEKSSEEEEDENDNFILSEINIKKNSVNKPMPILCSYEAFFRTHTKENKICELERNENEIIKCDIEIDTKKIPFSYEYKFDKEGTHIIKYSFKNYLTNINHLFSDCNSSSLNLSKLNLQNIIKVTNIFYNCFLLYLDISNFKAKKVTDMSYMFAGFKSLKTIKLSNFNTDNVTDMNYMFYDCVPLLSLDLSDFNTNNVTDMSHMFKNCISLKNVNISNFGTINVIDMSNMFQC